MRELTSAEELRIDSLIGKIEIDNLEKFEADKSILETNEVIQETRTLEPKQKSNNLLAIILKEEHNSQWVYVRVKKDRSDFSIDGNTYFKHSDGTYDTGKLRFAVYLEGVSVPIHHGYIQRKKVTRKVKNTFTGNVKEVSFHFIKGLKFDSVIADILLNRGLASEFTKKLVDKFGIVVLILNILILIFTLTANWGAFT